MINVGIVGIGFMGMIHYLGYQKVKNATVTAICSRDKKKREGDWRGIQGNFGPPGEEMDLSGVDQYAQLEEVLNDPKIQLVDICLPPHMHADAVVQALEAGKDVIVEKPMTLYPEASERMMDAVTRTRKRLFVAHVLPFLPEYNRAYQIVKSKEYGELLGGNFTRIISDPTWLTDFYNPNKVGGPIVDLHIHDAHFIRLLCGMPESVFCRGRMRGEVVEFMTAQFMFPNSSKTVSAMSGVINQQGRPFTHGFEIHLEQATLVYNFSVIDNATDGLGMPFTILTPDGKAVRPELGSGDPVDAFPLQLSEAVDAILENRPSELLSAELAQDALVICHKESESVKKDRIVEF